MKKLLITGLFLLFLAPSNYGQILNEGETIVRQFLAPSIEHNYGGEDAMRQISIYLPPDYNSSRDSYPTIYFLHGFAVDDSQIFQWMDLKQLMDKAIETKKIRPVILVLPNSKTTYGGSFYTNSKLIGNWSDYIAKDVVEYLDKNFRTIPNRENRGLSGHSMGGNGALKIAMLYPEVFSSVYAMSPAVLDWSNDFSMESQGFKRIFEPSIESDVHEILTNFEGKGDFDAFYATVLINLGRAYSPSGDNTNFGANYPITYDGNKSTIHADIQQLWEDNFPMNMIDNHLTALKSLNAIKMDWGRNDEFPHIPVTALKFSKKLEANGIVHFAEEYIGDHTNKLDGFEGRIYMDMLPFFEMYLGNDSVIKKD
ncbi:MAG: alpha/beta fold hydrolase [Aquaticitalea sp.]